MTEVTYKAWHVIDGPYQIEDDVGLDGFYGLLMKLSEGTSKEVFTDEVLFSSLSEAYQFMRMVEETFEGGVELKLPHGYFGVGETYH